MRKAACLLGALGLVSLIAGCVQDGYPNTAYAPNGYGYSSGGYYGAPNGYYGQQVYYGQQQGYYQQPQQYYGARRW